MDINGKTNIVTVMI